jgi:hypothetical protein
MAATLTKIKEAITSAVPALASTDNANATVSDNAHPDVVAPKANNRQRGPVEEVIAKRMRQLGKKLVCCFYAWFLLLK